MFFGRSRDGGCYLKGRGLREHIAPHLYLCHAAHKMLEDGPSDKEVAAKLIKYLKFIHIQLDEQVLLDGSQHFRLKQAMSDSWSADHGCEFARLRAAGMAYKAYEPELP